MWNCGIGLLTVVNSARSNERTIQAVHPSLLSGSIAIASKRLFRQQAHSPAMSRPVFNRNTISQSVLSNSNDSLPLLLSCSTYYV